ncbi:HET-domain-containing protein [Penicillium hetheringtonii]|uniref:HET-domain-containing protein n=1 Tax=Penicillium hetheringtonii TaxID=911720 RepID=A0AAD6DIS7_9EURO|nr:HET-domain-containing protein [Penicillium hetheringtonii]
MSSRFQVVDPTHALLIERSSRVDDGLVKGGYTEVKVRGEANSPAGEEENNEEERRGQAIAIQPEKPSSQDESKINSKESDSDEDTNGVQQGACDGCNYLYMEPGNLLRTEAYKIKRGRARGCPCCTFLDLGMKEFYGSWDTFAQKPNGGKNRNVIFLPTKSALQVAISGSAMNDQCLLDFYTLNDSQDVVLYEPTPNEKARYACLSYCWGGSQPLQLQQSNLAEMKTRILWGSLPKTYQDAVYATRALGIDFLWIDSLCIIQDMSADWHRGANVMADIYGNSTITLTATSAPNCDTGFLHDREAKFLRVLLNIKGRSGDTSTSIFIRPSYDHSQFGFGKSTGNDTVPLRGRAWAFQEYLLSPRSLQFGTTEMVWECKEHLKCECRAGFQDAEPPQPIYRHAKAQYHNFISKGSRDLETFHEFWQTLVREYTSKDLTHKSDLLIALAGVGKQIGDALHLEFCAGLWVPRSTREAHRLYPTIESQSWLSKYWGQGLAWRTVYCTPGQRPPRHRAPTWSWASVDHSHGVIYSVKVTDSMIIVLDVRCEQDLTGASHGYLDVVGLIFPATLHRIRADGSELSLIVERNGGRIPVYPDVKDEGVDGETVYCLILGKATDRLMMLVLRKGEGGKYRRLGTTGSNQKAPTRYRFFFAVESDAGRQTYIL